jgi:hypothetical protein
VERAALQAAPVTTRPLPGQPETFFSLKLQEMRRHEHDFALGVKLILSGTWDECRSSFKNFDRCLRLAEFELRHGIIRSWPGLVLLLRKLYGPFILPWAAPLFMAAVALPAMPQVHFDAEEVLAFASQLTRQAPSGDGCNQGNGRHGSQNSDLRFGGVEVRR